MPVQLYHTSNVQYPAQGIERRIVHTPNLMTVVIDITNGPALVPDAMHAHPHEQTSYVAKGELLFFMEGEEPQQLKEGDVFFVPSGKRHGIQVLSEHVRLVDSFTPLRQDFL